MNLNHVQPNSGHSDHRYTKPFINYHETLTSETSKLLRKRYSKYIHKISVPKGQQFISDLNHVKLLHSFKVSVPDTLYDFRSRSMYHPLIPIGGRRVSMNNSSHLLKVLKPMKNHIKTLQVGRQHQDNSLLRHFPNLKTYDLEVDNEMSWREFMFCCRVKELNMYLAPWGRCMYLAPWERDLPRNETEIKFGSQCIKKYGLHFVRYMIRRKSVQHLRVCFEAKLQNQFQKSFLELMNCSLIILAKMIPYLASSYLKSFTFKDQNSLLLGPQFRSKHPRDVLQYATHLNIPGCFWSPRELHSCVNIDSLKSLVDLSLSFSAKDSDLSALSSLSALPCLKRIDFSFEKCEEAFLEHFTLPKTVESVKLKLQAFFWKKPKGEPDQQTYNAIINYFKKDPLCLEFFSRWSGLDNLKELTVITRSIYEFARDTDLPSRFIMPILEQLTSLEAFTYIQKHPGFVGYNDLYSCDKCYIPYDGAGEPHFMRMPVFSDRISTNAASFLKRLEKSKLSIRKVYIHAPRLSFFPPKNLDGDMPKLESLIIKSEEPIAGGQNLVQFCKDSSRVKMNSNPLVLDIANISIEDNSSLIDVFDKILCVPETLDLSISITINRVPPENLVKRLSEFLAKTNMRGSLCLCIDQCSLVTWNTMYKIKAAALKNSSLKLFQVWSDEPSSRWGKCNRRYMKIREGTLIEGCDPALTLA